MTDINSSKAWSILSDTHIWTGFF